MRQRRETVERRRAFRPWLVQSREESSAMLKKLGKYVAEALELAGQVDQAKECAGSGNSG
jgi:hypothetical protein